MTDPFWTMAIRNRRELLAARHHARSIARMLRYDEAEQICVAAGTFAVACRAYQAWKRHRLHFSADGGYLVVQALPPLPRANAAETSPWMLRKPLPAQVSLDSLEDLGWMARQCERIERPNPFEEIARQNDEILRLLLALREKSSGAPLPSALKRPTAA